MPNPPAVPARRTALQPFRGGHRHRRLRPLPLPLLIGFCLVLALSGCAGSEQYTTTPPRDNGPTAAPTTAFGELRLLQRYHVLKEFMKDGQPEVQLEYVGIEYRPGQSIWPGFEGWDELQLPGGIYRSYTRPDWLHFDLNRDAQVVVLWNGTAPPAWLDSWTEDGSSGDRAVFRTTLPAGQHVLGGIGGASLNEEYIVLFAEADGTLTPAPEIPAGATAPQANAACPDWVHDSYTAPGPDDRLYPSWHPQIDPVYWCYIGHYHGSAGSLLYEGFQPLFNYAEAHGGPLESHGGFKAVVVNYTGDDGHSYRLYKETHADTSSQRRACAETHSHRMVLFDVTLDAVVLDVLWKPSFGPSRNPTEPKPTPYAPSNCPRNELIASSFGARNIPRTVNGGYETWQFAAGSRSDPIYPGLGIYGALTVAYTQPKTKCLDAECNEVQSTGDSNTRIWMITPGQGWGVNAATAWDDDHDGYFYTDVWGTARRNGDEPDAVRQYVRPGLQVHFRYTPRFFSEDAWLYSFTDTSVKPLLMPIMDLEGGLETTP